MTYVVLARKYRPRSFEQMVGQDAVVRALGNALDQQRLHHAYLFTGTRGIGKTTVSRILAKSLNCTGADGQGGITAHPCGVCTACTEIDADRYIDYIELDAASTRGIDDIKDLLERAAYKPAVGRYKVFMIDEAHQLTKDAFNALLKTLEEPPEYLKFVLATTDPDKMLPTVLSRCLQFNLRPMAPEVVRGHLKTVLDAEGVAHDEASLRLLARAARGSMRDALSLTDQAIAFGAGTLAADGVRQMLGSVERSHAAGLVAALARRDARAMLAGVDALRERGLSAIGAIDELCALLQQMAVEQAVPGALDADADPDVAEVRALARELPADETQLLYSVALRGREELTLAPDEYAGLTMVLLRLFAFPPEREPAAAPTTTPTSASAPATAAASRAPADAAGAGPMGASTQSAAAAAPAVGPAMASSTGAGTAVAPGAAVVADADAPAATQAPPPAPMPDRQPGAEAPQVATPAAASASLARPGERARQVARMPEPPPWLDQVPPEDDDAGSAPAADPRPHDARSDGPRGDPASAARPTAPPIALAAAEPAPLQTTPLGDRWAELVGQLVQRALVVGLVRELAWQAGPLAQDGAQWTLAVERESLRGASQRDKLQAALRELTGEPVALTLQPGTPADTPARRDAAERARRQRAAETTIRNDPQVQQLMAQFKTAHIVPGSIKHI